MNLEQNFKQEVNEVLLNHFGKVFAASYQKYYKDKKPDLIIASMNEILTDFLGEKISKKIVTDIKIKYKSILVK